MQMLRVLIADESEEFCRMLTEQMSGMYQVTVCREGHRALELIRACQPDILVLDLMLPGLDGISLLRSAADAGFRPAILATTRFMSDYILESLRTLGVGYVMLKPCDISATVRHITDLSHRAGHAQPNAADPGTMASNLLLSLGVPTKLHGYSYLREAVVLMAEDPCQSITKELYPTVGKRCGASGTQVERSMRSAIHSAWCQGDRQLWRMYFGATRQEVLQKPSNGAFISRLADVLRSDPNFCRQETEEAAQEQLLCCVAK